jgi:hypothetical protein
MSATVENVELRPARPGTLRVQRHRKRRRERLRQFTIEVPEATVEHAIARGLLELGDRAKPWPVLQACYAARLSDCVLDWLINDRVIAQEQRGDAAAILRGISAWLEQAKRGCASAPSDLSLAAPPSPALACFYRPLT